MCERRCTLPLERREVVRRELRQDALGLGSQSSGLPEPSPCVALNKLRHGCLKNSITREAYFDVKIGTSLHSFQ